MRTRIFGRARLPPSRVFKRFGSAGASPSRNHPHRMSDGNPRPLPQRKHPIHRLVPTTAKPTIVFLTVCTKDRRPWLAHPDVHDAFRHVCSNAQAWLVGRYVVMPDHLHLFATPGTPELPLENWIRFWKS